MAMFIGAENEKTAGCLLMVFVYLSGELLAKVGSDCIVPNTFIQRT